MLNFHIKMVSLKNMDISLIYGPKSQTIVRPWCKNKQHADFEVQLEKRNTIARH